jgi:uncharacterized protein (DUF58 family)
MIPPNPSDERSKDLFGGKQDWRERLKRVNATVTEASSAAPARAPSPSSAAWAPQPEGRARFLRPQDLRPFKNLLFAARMIVEGSYAGRHRSPYHDVSAEFADYRSYVPGDDIRSVDWKAVARTDRLFIKLFRKETDMSGYLLVDKSASMGFRGEANAEGGSKYEYCAYLAAAISYLMLQQGDRPGLSLCDASLRSFQPPGGTLRHLQTFMQHLERASPDGETNVAAALRTLFPLARKRGLLIVLSDLLEEPDALFTALGMYRHRGFSVLLFHVLTEEELFLPGKSAARYTDPEGAGVLNVDPESIRGAYRKELQAHLDAVSGGCKARGIHYQLLKTTTPYHEALSAYLTSRGR